MTEFKFKFACPVCGQHIMCEPDKAGSEMECPTCFRKIVVPEPPATRDSKFILTASQVHSPRPIPQISVEPPMVRTPEKPTISLAWAIGLLVMAGIASGVFYYFREDVYSFLNLNKDDVRPVPQTNLVVNIPPPAQDTNWTLNLEGLKLPSKPVIGRIAGQGFTCDRATLRGGMLNLRQGSAWPPDRGVTIYLFARQGEDLAGKTINIPTNYINPPRVGLRWKDAQGEIVRREDAGAYALRLEFGEVTNRRLTGRIYLCLADEEKNYVMGRFIAEIREPRQPPPPGPPPGPPR